MNLISKLIENKSSHPKDEAVQYFKRGHLYTLTWSQVYDRVEQLYRSFLHLGVQKGDRIGIYSNTCKEWGFLDLAAMACGAVTVPVYHSSHPDEVKHILEDSEPRLLFVENESLLLTTKKVCKDLTIEKIIYINEFESGENSLIFLKNIINCPETDNSLEKAAKQLKASDLATVIYTSGTSGSPKGVSLTHKQVMSSVADVFPLLGVTNQDKTLTFLPYSHVLGRMELWGHYFCGYCVGYAESIERIKKNIVAVKPTVIVGVPRIFEKIYFGIKAQVEISKLKQGLFKKAMKIGMKSVDLREQKKSPSLLQAFKAQMAHQMVFSGIHNRLGGNLRFAVSGGAPLDPSIADFFAACGIPVLEGYGLTETTGPIFVNTLFENRNGTVGKAVGDVKLRLDEDGEILIKSDKVMAGYFKNQQATREVITEDGYFRTGDIGELSEEGFLKITDRKKDLIKTAGGKFVAPQKLQQQFTTNPLINHIHIHGDKKKYIVALITLDKDLVFKIKKDHGISSSDYSQLTRSELIQSEVRQVVAQVNSHLASYETIKRFDILDHDFTIEEGQLTPSLKMKRKVIDEQYKKKIDALY